MGLGFFGGRYPAEVLIEPIEDSFQVVPHSVPPVGLAFAGDEADGGARGAGLGDEGLGLLEGDDWVRGPMDEQGGREIRREEADWGDAAAEVLLGGWGIGGEAKGGLGERHAGGGDPVLAGGAPVEEIGGGKETADGGDGAWVAVDGVLGGGVGGFGEGGGEEGQVAAGGESREGEAVGPDPIVFGVMSDEADGALDVGDHFLDLEFGLGAGEEGEHGIAAFEEGAVIGGADGFASGLPAAVADNMEDAVAVGGLGAEHIEGEADAVCEPVENVLSAGMAWEVLAAEEAKSEEAGGQAGADEGFWLGRDLFHAGGRVASRLRLIWAGYSARTVRWGLRRSTAGRVSGAGWSLASPQRARVLVR